MRILLKIFIGLVLIYVCVVAFTAAKYPLIAKWLTGSARLVGKPILAKVYTNGSINTSIEVYSIDEYFLLYRNGLRQQPEVIAVFPETGWAGTPAGGSVKDYMKYHDVLFQSETGGRFVRFNDGAKRNHPFDPKIHTANGTINFLVSPEIANDFDCDCDSIRIEIINSN